MTAELQPSIPAVLLPQTDFSVPGMRCAGCIAKIEGKLPLTAGIVAARANFTAKRVSVSHLPELKPNEIAKALADLGFPAQPINDPAMLPDHEESKALLRALAVAGFAMMNIMLLSVSVWSGAGGLTRDLFHWLSALIAMPTVAYAGRPFFRSAWAALSRRTTNMDVPISIGIVLTTALSLFETITHGPHAYFDGAVMLLFFLLSGRWLDSVMRDRARDGVTALLKNMATGAMVLDGAGRSSWIDASDLQPGMTMLVAAGERLAADGIIIAGKSRFDLSLLTGESAPLSVDVDAQVHAGTLNVDAPVHVRITAAGPDTAIADIARLMEDAGQSKSRYVRIADRAARLYAPAVHVLAASSFFGWMLMGAGWHQSILIAVAVLIITCPCALGLAVPAAQIVTTGALMRRGILVKDGSALERLAEVNLAFFDKTGTLTLGRPTPSNLAGADLQQKQIMLALARASRHPLSEALRLELQTEGIMPADVEAITEIPGVGVRGMIAGIEVSLGRSNEAVAYDGLSTTLQVSGKPAFNIEFTDNVRPDAGACIKRLTVEGVRSSILSGDRAQAVSPVARLLGLTAQTSMFPAEKLDAIKRQHGAGHKILMVGDGLNDGPALAAGHASIAPASASDAGQNAADIVFMGDSLMPVYWSLRAARATQRIVKQNFVLAIGYNALAVPMALAGLVTPLIAAIAMSTSSLIVVANALRLKRAVR